MPNTVDTILTPAVQAASDAYSSLLALYLEKAKQLSAAQSLLSSAQSLALSLQQQLAACKATPSIPGATAAQLTMFTAAVATATANHQLITGVIFEDTPVPGVLAPEGATINADGSFTLPK